MRRIAIFRALQLGDLLVAVPAFRALRQRFPHAEITLIGLPWAASFVQRFNGYIDRFVEFPGYIGIEEVAFDRQRTEHFLAEQRAYNYDVALQMHGSGRASNPFVLALGASVTIGYYEQTPAGLTIETAYPDDQHEIYRNLHLVELLNDERTPTRGVPTIHNVWGTHRNIVGTPLVGVRENEKACDGNRNVYDGNEKVLSEIYPHIEPDTHLEFPLFASDYAEADELLRSLQQGRPIIGIHPGARPPARRWPAEYFATVADALAQRFDAQILLTGGPGEEQTVQAVLEAMYMPAVSLAGRTSLGSLAALISRFDLFISNDTGPSHIACAVDCPSVTLFGPADVRRWAPLARQRHAIVRHPVACSPCGYWQCPIDHRCLRWLSPEVVLMAAAEMIQKENVQQCNV